MVEPVENLRQGFMDQSPARGGGAPSMAVWEVGSRVISKSYEGGGRINPRGPCKIGFVKGASAWEKQNMEDFALTTDNVLHRDAVIILGAARSRSPPLSSLLLVLIRAASHFHGISATT